jgi:hypothetical protein
MNRSIGWLAFATVTFVASSAFADGELYREREPAESPQHFQLEFRFSPYYPNIDSAPGITGAPYEKSFGTSPRLLAAFEFDWQAFRIPHFGTIGPALSAGYTSASGSATYASNGAESPESTSLEVFPMYAVAVLRVDVLNREFKVPLIPYAKGGVGVGFWRASNDSGTSSSGGVSGKGMTWGTQFALGIGLSLNWLDRRAARGLDGAIGINDTQLFFEWMWMNLNGFGATDKLYVGASTFAAGLSFAF